MTTAPSPNLNLAPRGAGRAVPAARLCCPTVGTTTPLVPIWISPRRRLASAAVEPGDAKVQAPPNAHWVLWCPVALGARIRIRWDFCRRGEPGLAMLFLGATSRSGGLIFDGDIQPRSGTCAQYHPSDIRILHAAFFRRRHPVSGPSIWSTCARYLVRIWSARNPIRCRRWRMSPASTAWRCSRMGAHPDVCE